MSNIAIIDYKVGNLFSVKHACEYLGMNALITHDAQKIRGADALILPGVGAFREGINNLVDLGLSDVIKEKVQSGTPLFGICLGLQLLFSQSEEFATSIGLDIIKGRVIKFPKFFNDKELKVPQIGWNSVNITNKSQLSSKLFASIDNNTDFYFVHSYFTIPDNESDICTTTVYNGLEYCSSILRDNIFATQFHPEKSGKNGIKIYQNWALNFNLI